MKNEAGLRPMKRGFATGRVFRALRFTATKLLLHTSRKACASYSRSECFIASFPTAPKLWTDSNRHTVGDDLPGVPINSAQTGRRGRRPLQFKNYLQCHRCNGILDRFEPPHQFETATNGKYKIALFFQWTDPNYRKPNNDLLKTKKKPRIIKPVAKIFISPTNWNLSFYKFNLDFTCK